MMLQFLMTYAHQRTVLCIYLVILAAVLPGYKKRSTQRQEQPARTREHWLDSAWCRTHHAVGRWIDRDARAMEVSVNVRDSKST